MTYMRNLPKIVNNIKGETIWLNKKYVRDMCIRYTVAY